MANGRDSQPVRRRQPANAIEGVARSNDDCACGFRFSLDGHELLIVQDLPHCYDDAVKSDLPAGSTRLAGCFAVGGGTYTIFSLDQQQREQPALDGRRGVEFLTQRELQIATLVMQGQVNKQIAYRLHIAPNTVQSHLKRIFCKLAVTSRAAMVARLAGCMRLGCVRVY